VPNDDNRALDGVKLREQFQTELVDEGFFDDEMDFENFVQNHDFNTKPCSLLEMLIALAQRMDFILLDDDRILTNVPKWFWKFIDNLGLKPTANLDKLNLIVESFLEREYEKNGAGGLFPIPDTTKDQRRVEIWYQMMEYIKSRM